MIDSDKDKVEALLKLADMSWRDYSERRAIEWKINFGLWLALGIFAGFMFQHPTELRMAKIISALLLGTFLVYTFLWKAEIKDRNRSDKKKALYYWKEVDQVLGTDPPSESRKAKKIKWLEKLFENWPRTHLSQVLITLLLVFVAIFALWAPQLTAKK